MMCVQYIADYTQIRTSLIDWNFSVSLFRRYFKTNTLYRWWRMINRFLLAQNSVPYVVTPKPCKVPDVDCDDAWSDCHSTWCDTDTSCTWIEAPCHTRSACDWSACPVDHSDGRKHDTCGFSDVSQSTIWTVIWLMQFPLDRSNRKRYSSWLEWKERIVGRTKTWNNTIKKFEQNMGLCDMYGY